MNLYAIWWMRTWDVFKFSRLNSVSAVFPGWMRTWDVFKLRNVVLFKYNDCRWMRTWDVFKFLGYKGVVKTKFRWMRTWDVFKLESIQIQTDKENDEWEHEMYLNVIMYLSDAWS